MMETTGSSSSSSEHLPHVHTVDCEGALQRLWDYLDGRLPGASGGQIAAHLEKCPPCARHYTFERSFLEAVRSLRCDEPGFDTLRDRVKAALRADAMKS